MKKVELLAPAGNYESFLGAVHAGADAVYLGGDKFGARAYADNFSEEEVIHAIRYAHLHGRKVYLTLNTLIKEREFEQIYSYLQPFYENGLDGVIIQDLGVFRAVGESFPGLERHISTQMTVTGAYGAAFLKSLGAERIVPARELSLKEIRQIKEKTDIEIEAFVHGAVCYCYSGQCLFSSIVGGRSGNRGRCAQPCRLPYTIQGTQQYPLSLKDMCTIELLPELIEAGIDSFKIEGRMKSLEYTAGVTSIYRKYIDRYYDNPGAEYKIETSDMEQLCSLYIRSEISTGYYHRHNGKEMITLDNPGYAGKNEILTSEIRKRFLEADFRLPITGNALFIRGKSAEYTVSYGSIEVTVQGEAVQEAQKQPLTEQNILKQLKKDGNTPFTVKKLVVNMEADLFMPVKALNDLRRKACNLLEEKIMKEKGFSYPDRFSYPMRNKKDDACLQENLQKAEITVQKEKKLHVFVSSQEQFEASVYGGVERIYVSSDIFTGFHKEQPGREILSVIQDALEKNSIELYLALPYIVRDYDRIHLQQLEELLQTDIFLGVLVRNLEEVQWLKETGCHKNIVSDQNLYLWNKKACEILDSIGKEHYVPYELNIHEIRELAEQTGDAGLAVSIYGRIPMMISANCVAATGGNCTKQPGYRTLKDRYHNIFPVYLNCIHCYNVIYNSLPLSLHQNIKQLENMGIYTFRLDFTTENGNDVDRIIKYFKHQMISDTGTPPYKEYTKGHFKRGTE